MRGPTSKTTRYFGEQGDLQVDEHGMIPDELLNEPWDEQDDQGPELDEVNIYIHDTHMITDVQW